MYVIAGLPRSGSTLLQNVLNQNPKFAASSTSTLSILCSNLVRQWSRLPEVQGLLSRDKEAAERKLALVIRSVCDAWHSDLKERLSNEFGGERSVVFDKGRGWSYQPHLLFTAFPESKIIVTVRDLRDVFASCEKQHRKTGLLDEAHPTIMGRLENDFSQNGVIGGPLTGINNLVNSNIGDDKLLYVKYEDLTGSFNNTMKKIYKFLDEDDYTHTKDDVINTADDPDWIYLYKYPHKGSGPISKPKVGGWREWMSQEVGVEIVKRCLPFMLHHEYVSRTQGDSSQQHPMGGNPMGGNPMMGRPPMQMPGSMFGGPMGAQPTPGNNRRPGQQ